jgi:colicin import membrane protein
MTTETPAAETPVAAVAPAYEYTVQNGQRDWKPGTVGRQVWDLCNAITARKGEWASAAEAIAERGAINEGSIRAGYASWRKFHGLSGHRIDNPDKAAAKAAKEAEAAAKAAEKVAKAEAKAAEKAAKDAEKVAKAEAKAAEKAAKDAEKVAKAEAKAAEKAAAAAAKEAAAQAAAAEQAPEAPAE